MKKRRIFITFLLGVIFFSPSCTGVSEPSAPTSVSHSPSPYPIDSKSPPTATPTDASVAPTLSSLPTSTAAPLPSPTLRVSPTRTSTPFLPASLAVIRPQNASRLEQVAALPEQGASVIAFSPDHRRAAAGFFTSNSIKIWDLARGQELFTLRGHVDPRIISYLAFSPDSSRLASGAQGWDAPNDSLILWDVGTGRELRRFDGVLGAVSPDWRKVAVTQREKKQDTTLIVSDLAGGKEIDSLKAPGDIYNVSFSPQGWHVAAKMYNVFQDLFAFWSVDTGRLDRAQYDWLQFSFSPGGRFIAALVSTGSGSDKGELNIFDAATFKWIKTLAKDADALWYTVPAFSPDDQILAASSGDHVTLWDTQGWKELASLPVSSPAGLIFSPDGLIFTTYTRTDPVQLWGVNGEQ